MELVQTGNPTFLRYSIPLYIASALFFYFGLKLSMLGLVFILSSFVILICNYSRIRRTAELLYFSFALVGVGVGLVYEFTFPVLFYPVVVNSVVAFYFIKSLKKERTLIEDLILKMKKNAVTPAMLSYGRKLTYVWSVFLTLQSAISLFTAVYGDLKLWAWYNCFMSYLLMSLIFILEYLFRIFFRWKFEHQQT